MRSADWTEKREVSKLGSVKLRRKSENSKRRYGTCLLVTK